MATRENIATLQVIATSVAFSPDGTQLALEHWMARWSCGTWRQNKISPHFKGIRIGSGLCHFHPMEKPSLPEPWMRDATTKLWNVATRENIATLQAPGVSVAFSLDGTLLAPASDKVELWDAATGVNIATLQGHTGFGLFCVIFTRWKNPRFRVRG